MKFKLTDNFINKYQDVKPPFGFNGLGEFVYYRTYSRTKEDGKKEQWWETIRRVVEGIYSIQQEHIENQNLGWDARQGQFSAQEMYDRMFNMKFLPGGRGLWAMGTPLIMEKRLFGCLHNCTFVTTENLDKDPIKPFGYFMNMSMLGCLAPDTLITTSNGVRRIKDLEGKPTNVVINGTIHPAPVGSWCSGVKRLYRISTKEGYTVSLTGNHRVKLYDGSWITSNNLSLGDKILLHNHTDQTSWGGDETYEQGYLLGIFWGDGYFSRDPVAAVHDKDIGSEGIAEEALRCVDSPSVRRNIDAQGWRRKGITPVRELSIGTWVRNFGVYQGNKRVTTKIEQSSCDFHRGFIRGAFDADGCVINHRGNSTRAVRLTQTSYEDLQAIQRMLLKFGIFSKIYKKRDSGVAVFRDTECKTKPCWELSIARDSIPKFAEHIGFSHSVKADKLSVVLESTFYKTKFSATVVSIDFIGESEVWDMEVTDVHAMDANGFYVHNSGVGFDTLGAGKVSVKGTDGRRKSQTMIIDDSREGWVESVTALVESHVYGTAILEFDYSQIRKAGEPLRTFGGVSSGSKPLKQLHKELDKVFIKYKGETLPSMAIVDVFNLIARCVVSGNVRRSASIALGDYNDIDYLNLKNYRINQYRSKWGWASNNSVLADIGMDYTEVAERIVENGEPGVVWLENCQKYSRMGDEPDWKDQGVRGVNPCGEMGLHPYESCNLAELYLNNHIDKDDFIRSIKFAYLYAKTVTLGAVQDIDANRVMLRNRRIGCGASGNAQFISERGVGELDEWLDAGYERLHYWDEIYSNWLCIPRSIKVSTVKPSGTTSLLAGATPGISYPISRYYIRRVRIAIDDELVGVLKDAGFDIEPDVNDPDNTVVISFPIDAGTSSLGNGDISMWEQLTLAAFMQKRWADNSVSFTCTFDPDKTTKKEIMRALDYFQYQLKGASFLPSKEIKDYPQMPYEKITIEKYAEMIGEIKEVDYGRILSDGEGVQGCDAETCNV